MKKKYEFAIKKDTLRSGRVIFTPVCRRVSRYYPSPVWNRITKIYDRYVTLDLDFIPNLSFEECEQHIAGYKEELRKSIENEVEIVEYHKLETDEKTL